MAHWSHCATNDATNDALPEAKPCDCGDDAPNPLMQERIRRGLSIEWHTYPGTGIEIFVDNLAVIYRINGQIYPVPRQLVTLPPSEPEWDSRW